MNNINVVCCEKYNGKKDEKGREMKTVLKVY